MDFKNETDYEFVDISSEKYRKYIFENGEVVIQDPLKIALSYNGHRVFSKDGKSRYIPNKWICLEWETKEGFAHFVK